jgi:ribosomal protein S12 methylthiotransferase
VGDFLRQDRRDITAVAPYGLPRARETAKGFQRKQATPFYTSYLKISEGCDNRCTFCTIPAIRGPYSSVPPDELLDEARELVERGVVELNLVAQDTTRYGEDLHGSTDLARLVQDLSQVRGIEWIRVLYAYPERVTERLIQTMASGEKIVPYLDLPLQHVSPHIRKKMGRYHKGFRPLDLIDRIRSAMPGGAVRSTLMVGFPGESEDDFLMLLDFVEQARIDHLGVFTFYAEEGTAASRMRGRVEEEVKRERYERIMTLQAQISKELNQARVGTVQEALVDGPSRETDLLLEGRARFQAPDIDGVVYITKGQANVGKIVPVRITQASEYDLVGEIVD